MKHKNIAIILAAGFGTRFADTIPKQFIVLSGKTIIEYTIDVFNSNDNIDEILIVTLNEYLSYVKELSRKFNKVSKVIHGGCNRYMSSWNAIACINNCDECHVLFHDAVRPFIDHRIINDVINLLNTYDAIDVIINMVDTLVEVKNNTFLTIPDRNNFKHGQTPQGFKLSIIKSAYLKLLNDPNKDNITDDCGIVAKYLPEIPIGLVHGSKENFKITYSQDIFIADNILKFKAKEIASIDFKELNEKITKKNVVIFGGNSGIGDAIYRYCKYMKANVYRFSRTNGFDITNTDCIKKALENVNNSSGIIHFVINSAAILVKKSIDETTYDEINSMVSTNLVGAINIAKESFDYLQKSKGMLINFTSSSHTRGRSLCSVYSSSKSAIVNLTQSLSEEWNEFNIRVNCISPERTKTNMRFQNFGRESDDTLLSVDNVAKYTAFVMCQDTTGQIFPIKKHISKLNFLKYSQNKNHTINV